MKTLTEEQIETLKTMDWQDDRGEDSTGALLYFTNYSNYFEKMARRYGLIKEFHENAII